jgi:hypothetical protein
LGNPLAGVLAGGAYSTGGLIWGTQGRSAEDFNRR